MSNLELQCLLGVQGNGFVMIAADRIYSSSILIMKKDENKLFDIDGLLAGVNGDFSDTSQFTQYLLSNIKLFKLRNKYGLSTAASVHFARSVMADGWRDQTPKYLNLLFGGYDDSGASLYFMDCLGTYCRVPFAWHGYGGALSLGILDRYYRPDMTEREAYEMLTTCVQEIQRRLIISLPSFQVNLVNREGIHALPDVTVNL